MVSVGGGVVLLVVVGDGAGIHDVFDILLPLFESGLLTLIFLTQLLEILAIPACCPALHLVTLCLAPSFYPLLLCYAALPLCLFVVEGEGACFFLPIPSL